MDREMMVWLAVLVAFAVYAFAFGGWRTCVVCKEDYYHWPYWGPWYGWWHNMCGWECFQRRLNS